MGVRRVRLHVLQARGEAMKGREAVSQTISQRGTEEEATPMRAPAGEALQVSRKTPAHGCSSCGTLYASPLIQKGTRHKACSASPAGRFGVPCLR